MSIRSNRYGRENQKIISEESRSLWLFTLKFLTGLVLGTTFSLVFRTSLGYGDLVFMTIIVLVTMLFLHFSRNWKFTTTIVFDLFCVLFVLLLRMYILIAPGA